jgi:DNA-binding NarL/FixJ family response regulator
LKILLVDDNFLYLEELKSFLQDNGVEVIGTAGNGLEALNKVAMLQPEMIVMDIEMAGCDGIEATRLIKQDFPEIEIVILTVSEDDEHLFAAIRAGASGYLLKGMDSQQFLAELCRLAAGEAVLAPGMAKRILREYAEQGQNVRNKEHVKPEKEQPELSPRQAEVLKLLAQGMTYKEIGTVLTISERTVCYHVNEIISKLHLANRTQLLANISYLNI